jgi:hypothetical protein
MNAWSRGPARQALRLLPMLVAVLTATLLVALAGGCGARAIDVAGTWQGRWTSADRQSSGTFRVDVSQRGSQINGPIELSLDWLPRARIEGIVEGSRVRWGVLHGAVVVLAFEGTVTGDAAEGTYTIGSTSKGAWTASRVGSP